MITRSEKLIVDFKDSFAGEPWYGDSVFKKLVELDFRVVNFKPLPNFNSIAAIVQHMINWRIFAIKKMQGDKTFDILQNDENDWTDVHISSQAEWDSLLNKLKETQHQIIIMLSTLSDAFFDEKVSGRDYTFYFLLAGIVQHDIYHLGQIALIKKWGEKH